MFVSTLLSKLQPWLKPLSFLLHQWFLLFLPWQSLDYYRAYLELANQLTIYRNGSTRRKAASIYLLSLLYFALNLYLWLADPTPAVSLLHSDLVYLAFQTPIFYPCLGAMILMELYFYHSLFFGVKEPFLVLLEDALFKDRHGVLEGIAWGSLTPQQTAQRVLLGVVNLLKLFALAYGSFACFVSLFDVSVVYFTFSLFCRLCSGLNPGETVQLDNVQSRNSIWGSLISSADIYREPSPLCLWSFLLLDVPISVRTSLHKWLCPLHRAAHYSLSSFAPR